MLRASGMLDIEVWGFLGIGVWGSEFTVARFRDLRPKAPSSSHQPTLDL